jgi:hypothetical protein
LILGPATGELFDEKKTEVDNFVAQPFNLTSFSETNFNGVTFSNKKKLKTCTTFFTVFYDRELQARQSFHYHLFNKMQFT